MKTRLVRLYFSCQWGIMGRLASRRTSVKRVVAKAVLSNEMLYERVRFPKIVTVMGEQRVGLGADRF